MEPPTPRAGLRRIAGPATYAVATILVAPAAIHGLRDASPGVLGLALLCWSGLVPVSRWLERSATAARLGGYVLGQLLIVAGLLALDPVAAYLVPLALVSQAIVWLPRAAAVAVIAAAAALTVAAMLRVVPAAEVSSALIGYATSLGFVVAFSELVARQYDERQRSTALARELAATHQRLVDSLRERDELAAARERNRIARDIHDGLGHCLTVVHIQIEAARALIHRDADHADRVLARVGGLVRGGLDDVRRSVGMLRTSRAGLRDALATWTDELRRDGIAAELIERGAPAAMAPAAEYALYRAAQEAITNVRKHAAACRVRIELEHRGAEVALAIVDDGRGATANTPGFGLLGLRERVTALGGTVDAGPRAGGGFAVRIALPASGVNA